METQGNPDNKSPFSQQKDQAQLAIRNAILKGKFPQGALLDLSVLQEWLVVGRDPMEQAMAALIQQGFVNTTDSKTYVVANPTNQEVEQALQTLGILMGGVLRTTVGSFSPECLAKMRCYVYQAQVFVIARDEPRHLATVKKIYDLLLQGCPNTVLTTVAKQCVDPIYFHFERAHTKRTPDWEILEKNWKMLIKAIDDYDPIKAQLAFEEIHRLPVATDPHDSDEPHLNNTVHNNYNSQ